VAGETRPLGGAAEEWIIRLRSEAPPAAPFLVEELQVSIAASAESGTTTLRVDGWVGYEEPM